MSRTEESRRRRFRDCIGSFATGVTIVTAKDGDEHAGMTLNSFTSVSLDPLLVLISLGHETRTLALVRRSGRFAVSILHREQQGIARDFAVNGAVFAADHTAVENSGFVTVSNALATVRCHVESIVPAGDHDVVIGAVVDFDATEGEPLVFHRGSFGMLGKTFPAAPAAGATIVQEEE